jgi:hypothetical protein
MRRERFFQTLLGPVGAMKRTLIGDMMVGEATVVKLSSATHYSYNRFAPRLPRFPSCPRLRNLVDRELALSPEPYASSLGLGASLACPCLDKSRSNSAKPLGPSASASRAVRWKVKIIYAAPRRAVRSSGSSNLAVN